MTASRAESAEPLVVGDRVIGPGERRRFDLPAARLPTHTELNIPLTVINGKRPGPRIWLSAAVHGDELNGVEVIRRVLDGIVEPISRGAILAVPIVNVFGFIGQSRYFPDRRDLNRSFPGSAKGSLASRMAHLFMREIVARCTHGIDLHTAAQDRTNLPQVRGDLSDAETRRIAEAFAAPVMIHSKQRSGSLRAAASKRGVAVFVYEGGEAQRFNERAISAGVDGVNGVLHELGILRRRRRRSRRPSVVVETSAWVRARKGGLLRLKVDEGDHVAAHQQIGDVSDPFGEDAVTLRAPFSGLVIGKTNNPVVHAGDAVIHVGKISDAEVMAQRALARGSS